MSGDFKKQKPHRVATAGFLFLILQLAYASVKLERVTNTKIIA
jgi:hypothetical protein